ncbi:serine hydrolase [Streptomyces sp. NPDC091268]|uniref:serine hydrolase n=1 Tax=Streptomyces sp. NPDC091268 TaxID=3365979 RepID=UPI00381281E6
MTLQSEDRTDRLRALVRSADPGAGWAVGGPDGLHAASEGAGPAAGGAYEVGGLADVLALWPVVGTLVEAGELNLHTPLGAYGGGLAEAAPAGTTAHHLLTRDAAAPPGTLARLVEHLAGSPLARCAAERIWTPLGMTATRFGPGGALHAPLADLARFARHLLAPPADPASPAITRAWTADSLRIRTGELTPARGLLWHPAPQGAWCHGEAPVLWVAPRHHRWALLLPTRPPGPLRRAFRDTALFAPG